jgi:branched-subunit amino acid transport protein
MLQPRLPSGVELAKMLQPRLPSGVELAKMLQAITVPDLYQLLNQGALQELISQIEAGLVAVEVANSTEYIGVASLQQMTIYVLIAYLSMLGFVLYEEYPEVSERILDYVAIIQLAIMSISGSAWVLKRLNSSKDNEQPEG